MEMIKNLLLVFLVTFAASWANAIPVPRVGSAVSRFRDSKRGYARNNGEDACVRKYGQEWKGNQCRPISQGNPCAGTDLGNGGSWPYRCCCPDRFDPCKALGAFFEERRNHQWVAQDAFLTHEQDASELRANAERAAIRALELKWGLIDPEKPWKDTKEDRKTAAIFKFQYNREEKHGWKDMYVKHRGSYNEVFVPKKEAAKKRTEAEVAELREHNGGQGCSCRTRRTQEQRDRGETINTDSDLEVFIFGC